MERRQLHRLSITLFVLLGIALVALAIADMLIGTEPIPVSEIVSSLWGDASEEHATIIYKLRMPKVIVAIVAGMALSLSSPWLILGYFGAFAFGIGLYSLSMAWVHQYMGHIPTALLTVLGALCMFLSLLLAK